MASYLPDIDVACLVRNKPGSEGRFILMPGSLFDFIPSFLPSFLFVFPQKLVELARSKDLVEC